MAWRGDTGDVVAKEGEVQDEGIINEQKMLVITKLATIKVRVDCQEMLRSKSWKTEMKHY